MTGDASNEQLRDLVAAASAPKAPTVEAITVPMIVLRIGARWFAVAAERVREVVTLESITSVPGVAQGILGVALVRGRLVPVVDLPRMLETARGGDAAITRPRLVVLAQGEDEAGVVADETRGVLELPPAIQAASGFVRGELRWNGNLVAVLDGEAIVRVVTAAESR
jgi:chemotaxis signal transduction protein